MPPTLTWSDVTITINRDMFIWEQSSQLQSCDHLTIIQTHPECGMVSLIEIQGNECEGNTHTAF